MMHWQRFDYPFNVSTRYCYCDNDIVGAIILALRPTCFMVTIAGAPRAWTFDTLDEAKAFTEACYEDYHAPVQRPLLVAELCGPNRA